VDVDQAVLVGVDAEGVALGVGHRRQVNISLFFMVKRIFACLPQAGSRNQAKLNIMFFGLAFSKQLLIANVVCSFLFRYSIF
jgi:hypothetical protein